MKITKRHAFGACLIGLSLMTLSSCSDSDVESTVDTKAWAYDKNMDSSVAPGDNFFMYCNGTWYNSFDLGENSYWGFFGGESQAYVDEYIQKMNSPITTKFYADTATIDNTTAAAEAAIEQSLEVVADIQTQEDAWKAIAKAMKLGYTPFFSLYLNPVSRTLKAVLNFATSNTNINITSLQRLGFNTTQSDEIINRSNKVRKILQQNCPQQPLTLEYANTHPEIQEDFVALSDRKTRSVGSDMLDVIFKELGISENDAMYYNQLEGYYNAIQNMSPEDIKASIQYCICKDLAFASHDNYNDAFGIAEAQTPFSKSIQTFSDVYMNYITSYDYYNTNVCTAEEKAAMTTKCKELITVYKNRISNLDWMSTTTKANAIKKLDGMILNVGYPDTWITEALPEQLSGTSLVEDMIQIRESMFNGLKTVVGKNSQEVGLNYLLLYGYNLNITNAAYIPSDNSINIFPVFLKKPFYSQDYSDAFNYAAALAVVGHEMTHSLDTHGSQFDENGTYKNWWTVADKMAFEERQQKLVDCVNLLEIMPEELPNIYADGQKTLGENTADLGGLELAHQAYMAKLAQEGYSGDELVKQEKKFFQSYAEVWRSKYTANWALDKKANNVHSLAKERVNATMMNIDRWYDLYNVKFGNTLYLTPEKRAHIW